MSTKCRARNPANCAYHGSPLNFSADALRREIRDNERVVSMWGEDVDKYANGDVSWGRKESLEAKLKRPILQLRLEAVNAKAVSDLEQKAKDLKQRTEHAESLIEPQSRQYYQLIDQGDDVYEKTYQEARDLRWEYQVLNERANKAKMYDSFRTQFQSSIAELKANQNQNLPEGIKNRAVIKTIDSHIFAHETSLALATKEHESLSTDAQWTSNPDYAKYKDLETRILAHKTILYDLSNLKEQVDLDTFVPTRAFKEYFVI